MSKPTWYSIQNKAGGSEAADVQIYDVIGYGVSADQFARDLRAIKAKNINVHINSPGGDAFDGIAIYNSMLKHPANITCFVDGMAASAASIIALGGDTVCMGGGAMMMIHNASVYAAGQADDMRQAAGMLDKLDDSLAQIYVDKTGRTLAEIKSAMSAETWYTAQEAVAMGLADRISDDDEDGDTQDSATAVRARSKFDFRNLAADPAKLREFISSRLKPTNQTTSQTAPRGAANPQSVAKDPMTLEQFQAFAASNPDAVASLAQPAIDAAVARATAAAAAKPATVNELRAAFPDHNGFVIDQLTANATLAQAKAAFAEVLKAEHAAALVKKDEEIGRLAKVANQVTAGANGVATEATSPAATAGAPAKPTEEDPKALAAWEWDHQPESRKGFSTKDRYVAIRAREISGEFRANGSTLIKKN